MAIYIHAIVILVYPILLLICFGLSFSIEQLTIRALSYLISVFIGWVHNLQDFVTKTMLYKFWKKTVFQGEGYGLPVKKIKIKIGFVALPPLPQIEIEAKFPIIKTQRVYSCLTL